MSTCGSLPRSNLWPFLYPCRRFQFSDSFAFSEPSLEPHKIAPFIVEFATNVLITGHKSADALPAALHSSSTAQSTGIMHFRSTAAGVEVERFERIHPTSRPNGARLSQQCPNCRAYRSWLVPPGTKKRYNKAQEFKCLTVGCLEVLKIPRLKGYCSTQKDHGRIYSRPL